MAPPALLDLFARDTAAPIYTRETQVWWPYKVPDGKSVCTTNVPALSLHCCEVLDGQAANETRNDGSLSTLATEQFNCMSYASPDQWKKCASDNVNGSTTNFNVWCNDENVVMNSAGPGPRVNSASFLGVLAVVAAAALAAVSAS
jgi:hypothetical protein